MSRYESLFRWRPPHEKSLNLVLLLSVAIFALLGAEGDCSGPTSDEASEGETFRAIDWQGLIDFVGQDVQFYIDDGAGEPPETLRKADVDDHGQARYSGYLPGDSTGPITIYYYIDADESGGCDPLWEPSGVHESPGDVEDVVILWGIEGNDRDMECEGFE